MKNKERVIPKKNYLYLLIMFVVVVFLTFIIFDINKKYQTRKLEESYLEDYLNEISANELKTILTEPSSEQFILITKTNNEDIYNFEIELKKTIKKKDLRDNFIYLDYTDKENEISKLNKILKSEIKTIPAIVYLKNGEIKKTIDSSNNLLTIGDFEKLLEEYEVE